MTESTSGLTVETDSAARGRRRRAVLSAWAGFAVDSYSIYIASSVLLPALVYFQGDMSAEAKAIFAGMTLAVTLLGRPLGGLIFGHFADRIGRRRIGAITIYGFGAISLLIACLPGAELIGAVPATTLLLVLRFVEGIFLGGEYTAATPMALTLMIAPSGGADSPYVQWGWRLPFVLGFILSFLVAWFLRRRVEESAIQQEAVAKAGPQTKSPVRMILRGRAGRAFIQAWVTMTGLFFVVTINSSVLNQFLLDYNEGYTAADLANTQLIIPLAMASYIFFGWLSDHIGRKRALYIGSSLQIVFYPVVITAVGSGAVSGWFNLTLLAVAGHCLTVAPFGVLPAYINERFATIVRSTGWGVAYGTAVIIPSFFSYYMIWLSAFVPFVYTAGILASLGGLLILIATICGPETRGVDLRKAGEDPARTETAPRVAVVP